MGAAVWVRRCGVVVGAGRWVRLRWFWFRVVGGDIGTWGGGGLDRVSAASGPPAPVLVSVLDGGVVVVTALVCGVARAVLMRAGPRQSSAVQH